MMKKERINECKDKEVEENGVNEKGKKYPIFGNYQLGQFDQ